MDYFHYEKGALWCEGVSVERIAAEIGTPFYLYSYGTLEHHFKVFDGAFGDVPHIVCFAAKANSNSAVLRLFSRLGGGADIVSGGELYRALQAGMDPQKIVYSGVGKKVAEIEYALKSDILMFNVESAAELEVIGACANRLKKRARIALRVNPDVDPETHPHISTGLRENKFGIDLGTAVEQYHRAAMVRDLDIQGISCHIGSQVTKLSPFLDTFRHIQQLIKRLKTEGISIKYVDLGGGLGIRYNEEAPPHPTEYARALIEMKNDLDCTFIFEPGRVIVGNAGILVCRVLYTKANNEKNFIIVDAGMNDLVRPSLYNSYHEIRPVNEKGREKIIADVVGPICESGDYLAKHREVPHFVRDELMAVMSAGAYGFTMSSNYNSRPRVAEVLVKEDRFAVVRKREEFQDLIRGEEIPDFLL